MSKVEDKCGAFLCHILSIALTSKDTHCGVTPVITWCLKCVIFGLTNRGPFQVSISASFSLFSLTVSFILTSISGLCLALKMWSGVI